jgi:hypothetical protein
MNITEVFFRLLFLLRFMLFVAVVYLLLHVIFARLISKSESKVLWFFSIVTSPLTYPVRAWFLPTASASRLRFAALVFYGGLWIFVLVVMEMVADTFR